MTKGQFIELVEKEQGPLRRFLCALCGGDRTVADDIAQEALMKAYLSYTRFEGRAKFSTWLFRIACNCYYDWRKTALPAASDVRREGFSDEEADGNFRHQGLYMAIDSLSENEKAAVLLYYMEDRPVKEIAEITGMPSVTVRSHLFWARKHLKAFLESERMK